MRLVGWACTLGMAARLAAPSRAIRVFLKFVFIDFGFRFISFRVCSVCLSGFLWDAKASIVFIAIGRIPNHVGKQRLATVGLLVFDNGLLVVRRVAVQEN